MLDALEADRIAEGHQEMVITIVLAAVERRAFSH
jgi:hypothetical protein